MCGAIEDVGDVFTAPFEGVGNFVEGTLDYARGSIDEVTGAGDRKRAEEAARAARQGVEGARDYSLEAIAASTPHLLEAISNQEALMGDAFSSAEGRLAKARELYQPRRTTGSHAISQLGRLYGAEGDQAQQAAMAKFEASPGYAFRKSEGEKQIRHLSQSGGRLGSGAMYKDLMKFGQGLASQEYGNYFDRLSQLSRLDPSKELDNLYRSEADLDINQGAQMSQLEGARGSVLSDEDLSKGAVNAGAAQNLANIASQLALIPDANIMTTMSNLAQLSGNFADTINPNSDQGGFSQLLALLGGGAA